MTRFLATAAFACCSAAVLLAQTGEIAEADAAYERAIGLESDPAVRRFLAKRRAALRG